MKYTTRSALKVLLALAVLVAFANAQAQNGCRYYLSNLSGSQYVFLLTLKAQADTNGQCPLSAVSLELSVGDGTNYHKISTNAAPWQTGMVYIAEAIITPAGPQQLFLNGQSAGTNQALFAPAQGSLFGSLVNNDAKATRGYLVSQISLQLSNGTNNLSKRLSKAISFVEIPGKSKCSRLANNCCTWLGMVGISLYWAVSW